MPNGGADNCASCGFNRANGGVWNWLDFMSTARLEIAFCTIRGVKITDPLYTYCVNFESEDPTPDGPICTQGLFEPDFYPGPRIPWHGVNEPTFNVAGTCSSCGRFTEKGIVIQTDSGEKHFCCNGHYVKWWRQQHPNEHFRWDLDKWPEPGGES
jgi:hypothetical protein